MVVDVSMRRKSRRSNQPSFHRMTTVAGCYYCVREGNTHSYRKSNLESVLDMTVEDEPVPVYCCKKHYETKKDFFKQEEVVLSAEN